MKLPLHEIWQGDILYLLNVDSQGRRSRSNRLTELYNVFAVVKGLIGLQHKSAEHCVTDVTWWEVCWALNPAFLLCLSWVARVHAQHMSASLQQDENVNRRRSAKNVRLHYRDCKANRFFKECFDKGITRAPKCSQYFTASCLTTWHQLQAKLKQLQQSAHGWHQESLS